MWRVTLAMVLSLVLAPSFGFARADLGDPQDEVIKRGRSVIENARNGSNDKARWSLVKDRDEAHGIYLRKTIGGKQVLTCTDTSSPKALAFEDGICLAETPVRIAN